MSPAPNARMPAAPMPARMPVYFLSHGGGPWPFMQGKMRERYTLLEQSLRDI